MRHAPDPLDLALIDAYQHSFPLVNRPFAAIAARHGLDESGVIARYRRLRASGFITRIGAIAAPNTLGASTLAAMKVPADRLEAVSGFVSALPQVNHNYLRENPVNLWFVVTAPDRAEINATLGMIENHTGLTVRDLRLLEPFHLDLGFPLKPGDSTHRKVPHKAADTTAIVPGDCDLLAAIQDGIALHPRPFDAVARRIGSDEAGVIERISALLSAHVIRRFGVVVRHRALGMKANAMAVWDIPDDAASEIGAQLARRKGVTLCYRRARADDWPYNVYCMVHGRSRAEAQTVIAALNALAAEVSRDHAVLFSTQCYKQTGARFATARSAA